LKKSYLFKMDILNKIINSLNKEEIRHLKLYLSSSHHSEERKDIMLFDELKKKKESYNEDEIFEKLYSKKGDKNAYYRLKNRLQHDILICLNLLRIDQTSINLAIHHLQAANIFKEKKIFDVSAYCLKMAEKHAEKSNSPAILDLVYESYTRLSSDFTSIDVEKYVKKRKNNTEVLKKAMDIDDLISLLTHKIKTSWNFSSDKKTLSTMQAVIKEYINDRKIKKTPLIKLRICDALSRMLLQQQNFIELEKYLKKSYETFNEEKIFTEQTHEYKLQILTYLINSLFKNHKYSESLQYTKKLQEGLFEYKKKLYDKYLWYYYNSLIINYSVNDKPQAIKILKEAGENAIIQRLPMFMVIIDLNLAVIYFDLKNYKFSLKNIVNMMLKDSYKNLDMSFKLKISVTELLIRLELQEFEIIVKRIKQVKTEFESLLKMNAFIREKRMVEIIKEYIKGNIRSNNTLINNVKYFLIHHDSEQEKNADVIKFNDWLTEKFKGIKV
jgi:hypothetical protein